MSDTEEALPPFDMGIKEFKKMVRSNPNLTKGEKNQAIKAYKERVYERVAEIKEKFNEVKVLEGGDEATKQKTDLPVGRE